MKSHESKSGSQQNPFLMTIIDPDHSYAKNVGDIITNSQNEQGQPFFSEGLIDKAGKLTNEEADKILPEIIELIYKGSPDQKPRRMIDQKSGSGTKAEFFDKVYDDLASGKYPLKMDKDKVKTIEQFTPLGLDTAVEYYNQKYPERGEIGRVQLLMNDLSDRPKLIEKACEELSAFQHENGGKVAISFARKNSKSPSGVSLDHSIPFVVTDKKLILMRDEHDSFGQPLFEDIAKGLGVELVQSIPPIYDKEDPKRTSIQGDHASCHFIALGVLKDLTKEDLQTVSTFENGFDHLPKSLKYSQSTSHIRNTLDEKSAKEPVKKDGRTAEQYAKQHKEVTVDGVATRVNDKFNRFKDTLNKAVADLPRGSEISDVAEEVLKEYTISKISGKTGLNPNQLSQIYQLPDESGKVDIKSMAEDFDNGKGVEKIQEKQKEFEQKQEESFVKKLGLEKSSQSESFVERMQAGKYGNIGSKGGAHEL